jgi:NAD(P)H-hydrate repair Nnr-like enzyme with NAD(P)H-hydrate epimerase domain
VGHAAARRHPLDAAVAHESLVAGAVAVAHAPGQHVGDGLEAAVRMLGEAGDVVARLVAAEGVQHQERIETALQWLGEDAVDLHARAIHHELAAEHALDATAAFDGLCGTFGRGLHCQLLFHLDLLATY